MSITTPNVITPKGRVKKHYEQEATRFQTVFLSVFLFHPIKFVQVVGLLMEVEV
jgi:hypothetical protein